MKRLSKRRKEVQKFTDNNKLYGLAEAVSILKNVPHVKFDETVQISFKLDVDIKQSDQMIRGTCILPHGTGKTVRVIVFCKGEMSNSAKEAGADFIGAGDLIEKINGGWLDFDVAISTPDMMRDVGKLGKVLGPKGLMPNPKSGTVTNDVAKAIKDIKAGRVEFKTDKQANVHTPVGKLSFPEGSLVENASALIEAIFRARPAAVKGQYIKNVYLSSTMGPGVKVDVSKFRSD